MLHAYQQWKNDVRRPFFFHRLQWKLTRAYVLVTVLLVAALQIGVYLFVMAGLMHAFRSPDFPPRIAAAMLGAAPQFAPHIRASQAPGNFMQLLVEQFRFTADFEIELTGQRLSFGYNFQGNAEERDFLDERVNAVFLTDVQGKVLAAYGKKSPVIGSEITHQFPEAAERLRMAQSGNKTPAQLVTKTPEQTVISSVPVFDETNQRVIGLFWAVADVRLGRDLVNGLIGELFGQLIWVPIFGLVFGLAFGFITARNLTHRLNRIAYAAGLWGQGKFDERAPEKPNDELGVLGERLNQMAATLQKQIALQQQLATMEERNRLALELHDTVKQQLFACAMQISAAQRVLTTNPDAARVYLNESAALSKKMQDELNAVIQELLPAHKQLPSLTQSLREITAEWTRQTGIPVALELETNGHRFAPSIERAVLRITQEALANIARHSNASKAVIKFEQHANQSMQLTIGDNGQGFIEAEAGSGLGLQSMRERAQALPHGMFSLASQPQQGTRIEVSFLPEPTLAGANNQ